MYDRYQQPVEELPLIHPLPCTLSAATASYSRVKLCHSGLKSTKQDEMNTTCGGNQTQGQCTLEIARPADLEWRYLWDMLTLLLTGHCKDTYQGPSQAI
jgi:hypothetical protein